MSLLLLFNQAAAATTHNAAADWEIDGELAVDGSVVDLYLPEADWEIDGELAVAAQVADLYSAEADWTIDGVLAVDAERAFVAESDWTIDGVLVVDALGTTVYDAHADWEIDGELAVEAPVTVHLIRADWSVSGRMSVTVQRNINGAGKKRVYIVDTDGSTLGVIDQATGITTSHPLNRWDTFEFTIPTEDDKAHLILDQPIREAQVWWEDVLLSWGPMLRPSVNESTITVRGAGAPWYLSRRHVGKASRENQLVNAGFESGLSGWNINKTKYFLDFQTPPANEATVGLSVNAKEGTQVLEIDATMVEDPVGSGQKWGDVFAWQELTVAGGERGSTVTLVGWAWVDTILAGFDDFEPHRFGLVLTRLETDWRTNNAWETANPASNTWGGVRAFYTDNIEVRTARIDENTPTDQWVRLETSITVPPGRTQSVICRLSGISGTVFWDRASATLDSAFEAYDDDQADIVCDLVDHAQDPAFDKNDVNLTCDSPTTGVIRDLVSLHSQHANIWNLIAAYPGMRDGLDVGVRYTPTDRVITTHYPSKGRYQAGLHLQLGRNVSSYRWVPFDAEAATSSVIVLGDGAGSDREETSAIDDTVFPDGLILETVQAVSADTPVEELDQIAEEAAVTLKNPQTLEIVTFQNDHTMPERDFIGRLDVGDTIPVTIRQGRIVDPAGEITGWEVDIDADYRVVSMAITEIDSLRLLMNRRDPT
jgi:hypothetical protein